MKSMKQIRNRRDATRWLPISEATPRRSRRLADVATVPPKEQVRERVDLRPGESRRKIGASHERRLARLACCRIVMGAVVAAEIACNLARVALTSRLFRELGTATT
jgi:hypothetical protein